MKILYLHGLDSTLSSQKLAVLEDFGDVIAPIIHYKTNNRVYGDLVKEFEGIPIDCIMGSSMGGFMGYYLANRFKVPCLLFNPAIPYRTVKQEIIVEDVKFSGIVQIALGMQDDIIKPMDTLNELDKLSKDNTLVMHLHHQMGHRIPLDIFQREVAYFFSNFKTT